MSQLHSEPRRIISTAPGITETLFALGLGDRVVGDTEYCRYPAAALKIKKIGTWMQPNIEAIVALRPDLVIVQQTAVSSSSRFDALHAPMLQVKLDTIGDIHVAIQKIGAAAGVPDRARALNESIERQMNAVHQRIASAKPTPVLFLVGRTPGTLEFMIAAGKGSYIDEAIQRAGGNNIFGVSAVAYAKIAPEQIIARDPHVIIDASHAAERPSITEDERRATLRLWDRYPTIDAVKEHRIYPVASEIFLVPGPRVVDLVQQLAKLLHPELFK